MSEETAANAGKDGLRPQVVTAGGSVAKPVAQVAAIADGRTRREFLRFRGGAAQRRRGGSGLRRGRQAQPRGDQLLRLIFRERRNTGRLDLEAIEIAVRSAMHYAGATALSELLQFPVPAADRRSLACPCGHQAVYQELRSKPVLTAVGEVTVSRPYYLCPHCHHGQFPADVELDIEHMAFSPGVRRMQAMVGQDAPFDQGRQQMKLLADLEVTTKAVERTAEAIGEDIARGEQQEVQRAVQLDLPRVVGAPIPMLYVQMDGTGVPVVKKETEGRKGKADGQPAHTREAKLGCVFTQTTWDEEGFAVRDPDSTTYVGAVETAEAFGKRLYYRDRLKDLQ